MVNQQCGNCKKVISGILEVCYHCKYAKETLANGATVWTKPFVLLESTPYGSGGAFYNTCYPYPTEEDHWVSPYKSIAYEPWSTPKLIYDVPVHGQSMDAKTRIENAERELRLAKESLTKEKSSETEVRSMLASMSLNEHSQYEIIRSGDTFVYVNVLRGFHTYSRNVRPGWNLDCSASSTPDTMIAQFIRTD